VICIWIARMSRDDLTDIPSFAANRDEAVSSAPRGAIPARSATTRAGIGLATRLVLTVALATAGVACGWAWQLQTMLEAAQTQLKATQARVADMEALLSDTDETVNKSAAAMGAQLRLLDTEVRKLWDARKVSNASLLRLEKGAVTQEKQITGLNNKSTAQQTRLDTMEQSLSALTQVAGDLERLAANAQRAQTDVERLADGVNKANLERAALRKQVESNAEWIESINAFRRQVNANITALEADIAAMKAPVLQ
jgi:chromosome segregation ATPase